MNRADLYDYDSVPTQRGRFLRFCCPMCGDDHAHDVEHQSLSLYTTGRYICHRCGETGTLDDYVRAPVGKPSRRQALQDLFGV